MGWDWSCIREGIGPCRRPVSDRVVGVVNPLLTRAIAARDEAAAYRGPDGTGALMGWADNEIEVRMIEDAGYRAFLDSKKVAAVMRGLDVVPSLASHLHPFQRHCVEFGIRAGSWGLFLDTGLGKTACELEWGRVAAEESNGKTLILTPLAVARQIEKEGLRWGYSIRVIRNQDEAREGLNVCNYDRMELLDPSAFGAVVLDESSIIKNFSGKTTMALIQAFSQHRWRMAASATPAPNDHTELGNHSEFLGVMPMNGMLVRWFLNDTANTGTWRLKGHARESFWSWMASWCRMAEHPRDLGDSVDGYDLPPLRVIRHDADSSDVKGDEGTLFQNPDISATGIYRVKRQTAEARARMAAEIVSNSDPWLVWVDTDGEQDALEAMFGDRCLSVRGSLTIAEKERRIESWMNGDRPIMVSKTSIMGFGLNCQFCWQQVFVGRTFSYESWYQAIRRSWRFGQTRPVEIHLVVAEGEDSIGRVIDRKSDEHIDMKREMAQAMRSAIGVTSTVRASYNPTCKGRLPKWLRTAGN